MAVSGQIGAIQPMGIKKRKQRYAPMIQEQAARGIATQMVLGRKEKEAKAAETGFREEQLGIQREQQAAQTEQWGKEYALRQQEIAQQKERFAAEQSQWKAQHAAQQQQWRTEMEAAKKQQRQQMILGGAGIAADLIGTYFELF